MVDVEFAEIFALILDEGIDIGSRDNALYGVLTESMRPRLLNRFRAYEKRAPFAFEDALQEFFLYLRGDASNAYSIFRELKDASSADAWLITTFRNFVSKKSRYGVHVVAVDVSDLSDCPVCPQDEQQKVLSAMASNLKSCPLPLSGRTDASISTKFNSTMTPSGTMRSCDAGNISECASDRDEQTGVGDLVISAIFAYL